MADLKRVELYLGLGGTLAPGFSTFTLNQSTDALEFIFQVPPGSASYTITRLGFRQGTASGTPPTYRVSLQGVDGTGIPDGVIKGATNSAYFDYTPTAGNNNTWQWVTLGETYSASPGAILCLVIAYTGAATIDASNNSGFTSITSGNIIYSVPYVITNDAGVRTRLGTTPVFGWGTTDTPYGLPVDSLPSTAFGSASTPDERGLKFTLPAGLGTYKLAGVRAQTLLGGSGAFDLKLYDSDGSTVLQQVSFDADQDQATATARFRPLLFDEATLATLSAGTAYRVSLVPTAQNLTLYGYTLKTAADQDAFPLGQNAYETHRTDAGAWTDDTLTRPSMGLILDDLTATGAMAAPYFRDRTYRPAPYRPGLAR
jgi:hypothetical protein